MYFLPDIYVPCEVCKGARYNRETLEVKIRGKSISDVLAMTVDEGATFFENIPNIARKLQLMQGRGARLYQDRTALADALGRRSAARQTRLRTRQTLDG